MLIKFLSQELSLLRYTKKTLRTKELLTIKSGLMPERNYYHESKARTL